MGPRLRSDNPVCFPEKSQKTCESPTSTQRDTAARVSNGHAKLMQGTSGSAKFRDFVLPDFLSGSNEICVMRCAIHLEACLYVSARVHAARFRAAI